MSTVAEVTDRVFREWLYAGDDQPTIVPLAGDVDASTQSWTYSDDSLDPEEEDQLAPGVIVECGTEQARVSTVDWDSNTLTVIRGVNGTTAATHSTDDDVRVAPKFSRHAVVEAVKDNVVSLYPSLWSVTTATVTTSSTYVEVPATVITPVSFMWQNGIRYQAGQTTLLENFPPSSTGKAIQFYGVPADRTGYFTYRAKFARPSAEDDELSSLNVAAEWERIVAVGAAAQVVAQTDTDRLTVEYVTEALAAQGAEPGRGQDVRNGLLTLRNIWIDEANRSISSEQQAAVTYNFVGGR